MKLRKLLSCSRLCRGWAGLSPWPNLFTRCQSARCGGHQGNPPPSDPKWRELYMHSSTHRVEENSHLSFSAWRQRPSVVGSAHCRIGVFSQGAGHKSPQIPQAQACYNGTTFWRASEHILPLTSSRAPQGCPNADGVQSGMVSSRGGLWPSTRSLGHRLVRCTRRSAPHRQPGQHVLHPGSRVHQGLRAVRWSGSGAQGRRLSTSHLAAEPGPFTGHLWNRPGRSSSAWCGKLHGRKVRSRKTHKERIQAQNIHGRIKYRRADD